MKQRRRNWNVPPYSTHMSWYFINVVSSIFCPVCFCNLSICCLINHYSPFDVLIQYLWSHRQPTRVTLTEYFFLWYCKWNIIQFLCWSKTTEFIWIGPFSVNQFWLFFSPAEEVTQSEIETVFAFFRLLYPSFFSLFLHVNCPNHRAFDPKSRNLLSRMEKILKAKRGSQPWDFFLHFH